MQPRPFDNNWPEHIDFTKQTVEVPGTKKPGETPAYRGAFLRQTSLRDPNSFQTTVEIFEQGLLTAGKDADCIGHRPKVSEEPLKFADYYVWRTYGDVDTRRKNLGSAIQGLFNSGDGLAVDGLETVALWSMNIPEWRIVDLAASLYGKVLVPLYDNFGPDSIEYILNHADVSILFLQPTGVGTILSIAHKLPALKTIVTIEPLQAEAKNILKLWAEQKNIKVFEMSELEEIGARNPLPPPTVTADTVATICYTSGTTGNPKGAVITQGAFAVSTYGVLAGFDVPATETITLLSYLPLAHIYERSAEIVVLARGGRIGYFTGSPLRIVEDLGVLKPNFFPSVPRLLNRIYQTIMAAAEAPGLKGAMLKRAIQTKLERLEATGIDTHPIWDRLVFKKVQQLLGGNLMLIASGSAPLNPKVFNFLRIVFSCTVIEGFGATETCATSLRLTPGDPTGVGRVGIPPPCNEAKLIDVPSMGYSVEDKPYPRGELLIRGDNTFTRYHKDPESTKAAKDDEGWVHTGDVAAIDECGRFQIIDRVKNIMKLSQGEYVALERVENVLSATPIVAQIFVYGHSLQSYLLAVLIPDPINLAKLASSILGKVISDTDIPALDEAVKDERVVKAILDILTKESMRSGLKGYEYVRRIHVSNELFSMENGTLTPTFKIKRKDAAAMYQKELDALYALGEPQPPNSAKL